MTRPASATCASIGALVLVASCLLATGCGRLEALAMVEPRPSELTAPGCFTSPASPRAFHYRAQLDMGERPPSSSSSASMSAISRSVRTAAVDSGYSLGSVLVALQVVVVIVAMILAMFVAGALGQKQWRRGIVLGVVLGGLGLFSLVLGYLSGSVISIDNPTDRPVSVTVDGTRVEVPPRSFTDVRVMGPTVSVRAEGDGRVLEEGTLSLDDNVLMTLVRIALGNGRYIYTVCGGNGFTLGHFTYG